MGDSMNPMQMIGSAIQGTGALISGGIQAGQAGHASQAQENAGRDAQANAGSWYDTAKGNLDPYTRAGNEALDTLRGWQSNPSSFVNSDPGAQWRYQRAMEAIQRSAAARGGLASGGTLKALQSNASDLASQEYNSAWQRLMGQAGMGLNATNSLNGVGSQAMGLQNQNILGVGNAEAAGSIAKGNAWANANNTAANAAANMFNSSGTSGGWGGGGGQSSPGGAMGTWISGLANSII